MKRLEIQNIYFLVIMLQTHCLEKIYCVLKLLNGMDNAVPYRVRSSGTSHETKVICKCIIVDLLAVSTGYELA